MSLSLKELAKRRLIDDMVEIVKLKMAVAGGEDEDIEREYYGMWHVCVVKAHTILA